MRKVTFEDTEFTRQQARFATKDVDSEIRTIMNRYNDNSLTASRIFNHLINKYGGRWLVACYNDVYGNDHHSASSQYINFHVAGKNCVVCHWPNGQPQLPDWRVARFIDNGEASGYRRADDLFNKIRNDFQVEFLMVVRKNNTLGLSHNLGEKLVFRTQYTNDDLDYTVVHA